MIAKPLCMLALPAAILLGAATRPPRPSDAVPIAVEIVAMPAEMDVIRHDPTLGGWRPTCEGKSGEEQIVRFAVPAGTDRATVTRLFGDADHLYGSTRRFWFAGDTIPRRCDMSVLKLVLTSKHVPVGVEVDPALLTAGPPARIAPLAGIARQCGFTKASARPFRESDVTPHPAGWQADWVTLDAGEKVAPRPGPIGCFRHLSADHGEAAPARSMAVPAAATSTTTWTFDQEPSMCIIQRGYGTGDDRRELALREHVGLRSLDVVLSRPKVAGEADNWLSFGSIQLLPSGRLFEGQTIGIDIGDGRQAIRLSTDAAALDLLETSNAVVIVTGHGPVTTLAIDHFAVPRDTLRACRDDVMRGWGVDPARFRPLTLPGEPDPENIARYFPSRAYPRDALKAHQKGRVVALIEITPDGHVAKCAVVDTSHSASLDKATCNIARNRFQLSRYANATGKAVTSWRMFAVLWVAP